MRDPKRIDRILRQLKIAWKQSPNLRLGQLLVNVAGLDFERNPAYFEDDRWGQDLSYWIGMIETAKVQGR